MKAQRGIALIQVLLISGIIGLLMMQLGLTAREQVARAKRLDDRATLEFVAQSRESALLYTLFTEPWVQRPEGDNPYAAAWNFMGLPFDVDGVAFTLQDESGRLRVPTYGAAEFSRSLAALGVEAGRAQRLGAQLLQVQGVSARLADLGEQAEDSRYRDGRVYPLQDLVELKLMPDMDEELYQRLIPFLTLYPTPGFNPMTAPPELLRTRLSDSQLQGFTDARDAGQLDQLRLMKTTGMQPDEMTVLAPGPALEVHFVVERNGSRIERRTTFVIRPYQSAPLGLWQRSGSGREDGA